MILTFFASAIVYDAANLPVFAKFSSFRKLQRVILYVKRFVSNCKIKDLKLRTQNCYLTIPELRQSLDVIIEAVQHEILRHEINRIENNEPC